MKFTILKSCLSFLPKKGFQSIPKSKYSTTIMSTTKYETISVSVPKPYVYMVQLNRPTKLNSINNTMWSEFKDCFNTLAVNPDCRAILLSGAGKSFCAGIDLQSVMSLGQSLAEHEDVARKCKVVESSIKHYQEAFTSAEKCPKPVVAAVHGACIGAGVEMICSADIRYCTANSWFQIKEVILGLAADLGTLQRFPKIVGSDSLTRELVYTGRKFTPTEALQIGFVSKVFDNEESLLSNALQLAEEIAKNSPVAVQGSKISLVYSRDHSVEDGLNHISMRNQVMLQSEDFLNAAMAQATKDESPVFSKL